jgi:tripeptidyl-peptidase-1
LQVLYDLPPLGSTPTGPSNALGLFESDGQLWDQKDLNSFFETVLQNATDGTHPDVVSINGAVAEGPVQYAGGEMILDLTIAYSIIYPQTVTVFQSQGTAKQNVTYYQDYAGYEALLDAIDGSYCDDSLGDSGADCGTTQLTRVFSTSYGVPEIYLP